MGALPVWHMLSGVEKLPASTLCDRLGLFLAYSQQTLIRRRSRVKTAEGGGTGLSLQT